MKTVNRYIADDGSEFTTEGACRKYEGLCGEVNAVMARLPVRPSEVDYQNGGGYLQHDPETWQAVKLDLLHIIKRVMPHEWVDHAIAKATTHPSWVGRLIDDGGEKVLRQAWFRIYCTDSEFREWGQPYYAANPGEGKQVVLNP